MACDYIQTHAFLWELEQMLALALAPQIAVRIVEVVRLDWPVECPDLVKHYSGCF